MFFGVVTPILYENFGVRNTLMLGGAFITGTHLLAIMMLGTEGALSKLISFLLVLMGILGGQGANIVLLTVLGSALNKHSIINTNLVSKVSLPFLVVWYFLLFLLWS